MPFKSKAQRRWMYENMPETAKRWEVETPSPEALPNRIHKKDLPTGCRIGVDKKKENPL